MNFYSFYTLKNIKNSKASTYLISFCVFVVTLLLMVILCMPTAIKNTEEAKMREFYGSSDIYIAPDLTHITSFSDIMANYIDVPQQTKQKIEYFSPMIAIPGDIANDGAYLLMANLYDIKNFNTIQFASSQIDALNNNEIIISQSYANEYNLSVGNTLNLYVFGYQKEFVVKAIAKNTGLFSGLDREVVLCSKAAIRYLDILPFTPSSQAFNLAVLKVKDPQDIDEVITSLKQTYPSLNIGKTVDIDIINDTVNTIMPIYYIIFALITLFALFTTFYICYNNYKARIYEFSRIKCMGGKNSLLLCSLLLENLFYASIGIVLDLIIFGVIFALKLPILNGVNLLNMLYVCLFGYAFSFATIPFAYISFVRKSIKQTLSQIPRRNLKWLTITLDAVWVVTSIITLILICTLKLNNQQTLILYLIFAISLMLACPVYLTIILNFISLLTRKIKSFYKLYLNRFTSYSSTPLFIRLITFSMFAILIITLLHSSIQTRLEFSGKEQHYNISLSNISLTSEAGLNNIKLDDVKQMQYVNNVYALTVTSGNIDSKNYTIYGYDFDDITSIYATNMIEGTAQNNTSSVVLGPYFKYVLGYNVNDNILLDIGNNTVITLQISGFSNNYYNDGKLVLVNKQTLKDYANLDENRLFIDAEDDHIRDVIGQLKTNYKYNMLVLENTQRANTKIYSMIKPIMTTFYILIMVVVIMIVLSIVIAYRFLLNTLESQMFTFRTLGLNKFGTKILVAIQVLLYGLFSLLMGVVLLQILKQNFTSIIANLNMALQFNNNIYMATVYIALFLSISFGLSLITYNKKTMED